MAGEPGTMTHKTAGCDAVGTSGLLSCPFCGCDKAYVIDHATGGNLNTVFNAHCPQCGLNTKYFTTEGAAADFWNTRTT